jgi:hypothetical protein
MVEVELGKLGRLWEWEVNSEAGKMEFIAVSEQRVNEDAVTNFCQAERGE